MKLVFGLSIGFKNGMSWPHCTKTHVLVWVLGNGPFPDQGPIGGAHGAGSPTQQYDFLLSKPWIFQFISCSWSKVIPFLLHILHPYMHRQDFFIYGNLYLSLHYVPLFALLTHSLCLWRINFWGIVINTTTFHLGQYSFHLLLLKRSMDWLMEN